MSDCYQQPGDSQFNNMVNGYYIYIIVKADLKTKLETLKKIVFENFCLDIISATRSLLSLVVDITSSLMDKNHIQIHS